MWLDGTCSELGVEGGGYAGLVGWCVEEGHRFRPGFQRQGGKTD